MTDRSRRHPAAASRVAALGLGTATMLGLVGAMTIAHQASADQPAPLSPPVTAPQIVVVVHQADGATTALEPAPAAAAPAAPAAPAPVVLTARPVTVAAPASAAPAASTHGSR